MTEKQKNNGLFLSISIISINVSQCYCYSTREGRVSPINMKLKCLKVTLRKCKAEDKNRIYLPAKSRDGDNSV